MHIPSSSTGVAITNPLVLYRALVATKRIDPDPAQHRLAIHLQKLYERLKDYEPVVEYNHRIRQISRALSNRSLKQSVEDVDETAPGRGGWLGSLFEPKKEKEAFALTRILTSQEAAMQLDSPKGLMLHGEVGTGKSMLIDLFADCLPNRKKKRWHFTTFMLDTMSQLEQLRRSRTMIIPSSLGQQDDYSLLWLARNMISTSPILFLDEFQLPDRASSKILTNLLTSFFHLGGVLIATSNRMPEELAKAAGMEFALPLPTRLDSLKWTLGLSTSNARRSGSAGLFSGQTDFAAFLDVLKARCEVWQMESRQDYRRRDSGTSDVLGEEDKNRRVLAMVENFDGLEPMEAGNIGLGYEQSRPTTDEAVTTPQESSLPNNFFVSPGSVASEAQRREWMQSYDIALALALQLQASPEAPSTTSWSPGVLRVYGRDVLVPRQRAGITAWTFPELCGSMLGPADYITLASTYHTLILTDVPVLTILHKNEARRFITLLDALYEARCKLFVTADAGPDDLFFPESRSMRSDGSGVETVNQDAVYAETFAEAYQDTTAPFRPNISTYGSSNSSSSPSFEPDYTHPRVAGIVSQPHDQLEDQPYHRPSSFTSGNASMFDHEPSLDERDMSKRGPDFSKSGAFTGEDEQFAYKRARSRLWEMCGSRWWARSGKPEDWWRPVDRSVRTWEPIITDSAGPAVTSTPTEPYAGSHSSASPDHAEGTRSVRDVNEQQDEVMFRHGASPFRRHPEPPPKISDVHVWGVMKWGKKAGAWGKGVEGLDERKKHKDHGEDGGNGSKDR